MHQSNPIEKNLSKKIPIPLITPREMEILYLIAYEHSTKEIAAKLFISIETVSSHRKNIMTKLDVKNTAGMVRVACLNKLLDHQSTIL